jgi:hypothetical protein
VTALPLVPGDRSIKSPRRRYGDLMARAPGIAPHQPVFLLTPGEAGSNLTSRSGTPT